MTRSSVEWDWGGWVLGDLADCLRLAGEALGGDFELVSATASPPSAAGRRPSVVVVVGDVHTSYRLRAVVREREPQAKPLGQPMAGRWCVDLEGLQLTVTTEEVSS